MAKNTDGKFSYHLVRIALDCSIGQHTHEDQLETHEVINGSGKCVNAGRSGGLITEIIWKILPLL